MDSEENNKIISNSQLINILLSLLNWENNREEFLKINDINIGKTFYLINKEWYDKFKQQINYQKLKSNLTI